MLTTGGLKQRTTNNAHSLSEVVGLFVLAVCPEKFEKIDANLVHFILIVIKWVMISY